MVSPTEPFILISFPRDMEYLANDIRKEFERIKTNIQEQALTIVSWNIDLPSFNIHNTKPAQEYVPWIAHPLCRGVICLFGELLGTPLEYHLDKKALGIVDSDLKNVPFPTLYPHHELDNPDSFPITGTVYECLSTWRYNEEHNFQEGVAIPMLIVVIGEKEVLVSDKPTGYEWGNRYWLGHREKEIRDRGMGSEEAFAVWQVNEYFPGIRRLFNFLKYIKTIKNIEPAFDKTPDNAIKRISHFLLEKFGHGRKKGLKPFKGLKYYNENDGSIFFGREQHIQEVLSRFSELWSAKGSVPFFGVYGGSGVGKSSFLRAGLIARIRKRNHYGFDRSIVILSDDLFNIRQKDKVPLIELYTRLLHEFANGRAVDEEFIQRFITRSPDDQALTILEKISAEITTGKLIIALDQFEYLVDLRYDDECRPILEPLFRFFEKAVKSKAIGLIVTCQTNRQELLTNDPVLGEVSDNGGRKTLRFTANELEEIVTRSFEISDVEFDATIKAGIIEELGQFLDTTKQFERDSLLPIISNTLDLFYETQVAKLAANNKTEISSTKEIKDIKIINVKDSIDQLAEKAIDKAREEHGYWDEELISVLLRKLVRIKDGNNEQLILLKAEAGENNLEKRLVACLKEFRILISIDGDYFQFVHEAVVRYWKRAANWLEKENKLLEIEESARIDAIRWEKNGKAEGYLITSTKLVDDFTHLLLVWVSFYNEYESELNSINLSIRELIFSSLEKLNTPYAPVTGESSNANHFLLAAYYGRCTLLKKYFDLDENVIRTTSSKNANAVYFATFGKSIEALELLLSYGGDASMPTMDGWCPIHVAVDNGNKAAFDKLMAYNADPLVASNENVNILHLVCANEDEDMFDHLLQTVSTFNFNEARKGGWTPLHFAAYGSSTHILKRLLQVPGIDVNIQEEDGWTPLILACNKSRSGIIHTILDTARNVDYSLNANGWSALHMACRYAAADVVSKILSNYSDNINEPTSQNNTTWKPVQLSIYARSLPVVEVLLKNEHIIHQYTGSTESLYNIAYNEGTFDILEVLWNDERLANSGSDTENRKEVLFKAIEHEQVNLVGWMFKNIDHEVVNNKGTILHAAVRSGSMEIIKLILQEHSFTSLINATDESEDTPLHLAVKHRKNDMLELLISRYKADFIANRLGLTPLHEVFYADLGDEERLTKIKIILSLRPSLINYKDHKSRNLLHLAIKKNAYTVVGFLVAEGIKLEERDGVGRTALHYLALYGTLYTIYNLDYFLTEDSELKLTDNNGISPLHICCQLGKTWLIEMLPFGGSGYGIPAINPELTPIEMLFECANKEAILSVLRLKGIGFIFKNMNTHPLILLVRNNRLELAVDLIIEEPLLRTIDASQKPTLYTHLISQQETSEQLYLISLLGLSDLKLLPGQKIGQVQQQLKPLKLELLNKDGIPFHFINTNDYSDEILKPLSDQAKIRDHNTCQYCGFTSGKYLEVVVDELRFNDLSAYHTACHFCAQHFQLEFIKESESGVLIWFPELEPKRLMHLMRDIYVARIRSNHASGDRARAALDFLLSKRELAKQHIGTFEPAELTAGLINSDIVKNNIRLMPLDRRIVWEGDLKYNMFPQTLAYWRSKEGPYSGGIDGELIWLDEFYKEYILK